jgi:cytochrome b561
MAANQAQGYTLGARVFHWLTAALVLTSIPMGITMVNAPNMGPVTDTLFHLHRSIGALVLFVMLGRLVYRFGHPPPKLPHDMSPMLQTVAHVTHWTLYALLIVQPILGWVATSAYRAPVLFFWMFDLPPIWPEDRAFSEAMFRVHMALGVVIALLIGMHIAAALYHHFVLKDRILARMAHG